MIVKYKKKNDFNFFNHEYYFGFAPIIRFRLSMDPFFFKG